MQDAVAGAGRCRVSGVLFDMGGTLYGYESRQRLASPTDEALRRLGIDPDTHEARDARRVASDEIARRYSTRRWFLHRDLFRDRLERTAELLGVAPRVDVLERFDRENVDGIIEQLRPRSDAGSVLRALGERGIYRAIVSNADESWLGPSIRRHRLDDILDDWTSSEEARSCKPDGLVFASALDKSGLDPTAVLFVGDSVPHDVVGAHHAGMRTVLIADRDDPAPLSSGLVADVEPDFRIERLTDLLSIVDDLNGRGR